MKPEKIQRFERFEPNPDLIRLTEKIIDQNNKIIEMNARLLAALNSMPVLFSEESVPGSLESARSQSI
jgi:hypothetical protein